MSRQKSICVYCGSKVGKNPVNADSARQLGILLAERKIRMIYGGGSARAAMDAGGHVVGVITQHLEELEVGLTGISMRHIEATMHARKMRMYELSDGFIALPGGSGTLDEIAEILCWHQIGLHNKPAVLLNNTGYWEPLMLMLRTMYDQGFLTAAGQDYFYLAKSVEDAVDYIEQHSSREIDLKRVIDLKHS
ncbi:MAG: TIGR00730 family Rossman fold protein [Alphaproteobacteria bacterium]